MTIEEHVRRALAAEADRDRLPAGFSARVVAALPARRPVRPWRWPVAAAGAAALVVAVALVASQVAVTPPPTTSPNVPPSASAPAAVAGSPSPTGVPTSPSPTRGTSTDPDGIPSAIEGMPVIRGGAVSAFVSAETDDSSFLIGGRISRVIEKTVYCPPPILPDCNHLAIDGIPLGGDAASTWPQFVGTDLVLRVHVHDPRAAVCDAAVRALCEQTIVPDTLVWVQPAGPDDHRAAVVDALAGRYDDGLPMSVGGRPVLRGSAALAFARTAQAGSSFLVAGWVTQSFGLVAYCPLVLGNGNWLQACLRPGFSDVPGTYDAELMQALTLQFLSPAPTTGPVVLSVHTGDPRASACVPDPAVCAAMMVAEEVVWSGDSATDPRGLDSHSVTTALRSADPSLSMVPVGPGVSPVDCSAPLPGAVPYVVSGAAGSLPTVTSVWIAPTAQARARVVPLRPLPTDTLSRRGQICTVVIGGAANPAPGTHVERWLVYDNVALAVSVHEAPTAADRAYLDRLFAALGAADPLP